jgi:hypothetical protein
LNWLLDSNRFSGSDSVASSRNRNRFPVRRRRFQGLHGCDLTPDSIPHLLERAHLDLAHPLARDSKFLRESFKRDRLIGETACLENAPLAPAEHREGLAQRLASDVDKHRLLAQRVADQQVLPFARIPIFADR